MKKYLIKSVYFYYDDFDIQDVCVCDTKEQANKLINEYKHQIETFKKINGYVVYLDDVYNEDDYKNIDSKNIIKHNKILNLFLSENDYKNISNELLKSDVHIERINYFEFLTWHTEKDTIIKKICNHISANLIIEEIDYIKGFK
jgi:hypothetical protein